MKFLLVASIVAFGTLRAQDVSLPLNEGTPVAAPLPAFTPAPQLIPDDVLPAPRPDSTLARPPVPTLQELDKNLQPPPLSPAAEGYRKHLEWRKLRNYAVNDAAVKAALATAEAARTDLEKRKLLRSYYELVYRKMAARAPADMKQFLQDRKGEVFAALAQPHVRPDSSVPSPQKPAATPAAASNSASEAASAYPTATPPVSGLLSPFASPTPTLLPKP